MPFTKTATILTYEGAAAMLAAAIAKSREINVPQCICVVDAAGHLLAFARMDGAFAMSEETALAKARTSACYGVPTGGIAEGVDIKLAIATQGRRINLFGGLPVIVAGTVIGAIGVGSGSGEQDTAVAAAGLAVIPGAAGFD